MERSADRADAQTVTERAQAAAGYLAVCTAPSAAGATSEAAASIASVLMPDGASSVDVKAPLHRLDVDVRTPGLERGVQASNRVGEALATLSLRWTLVPDDFTATPSGVPPATPFRDGVSQRFVMQGGTITFNDRAHSTVRFFGAGRTYPAITDGRARLMMAGTAVIVEATGSLKGARGTLLLTGEVTLLTGLTLSLVGRFEPGGPVREGDTLTPFFDQHVAEAPSTTFTFTADSGGALRGLRIGSDLASATILRSAARESGTVGAVSGAMRADAADRRCAVPVPGARRLLAFSDGQGRQIGSLSCAGIEVSSYTEVQGGQTRQRLSAYGVASEGTGACAGAGGVVAFDLAVDGDAASGLYVLRLADPGGRFRTPAAEPRLDAANAASLAPSEPAAIETLAFVDGRAGLMTAVDREIVRLADSTLARGTELLQWWERKDAAGDYPERIDVVRQYAEGDGSFGFFDKALVGGAQMPVMGIVQEMFYDRQKVASPDVVRDQMREFVLHYFMRVCQFREPEPTPGAGAASRAAVEEALTWLPGEAERRVGFRYQQLYYKLAGSGRIGKFSASERERIVDLRRVGETYDWIVLKVDIYDFQLSFAPFGDGAPKMQVPLKEAAYLVLGPAFVRNADAPAPGVLAEYGFGYAFLPYAPPDGPPMLAYGPGHFACAIKSVAMRVMDDGEVRLRAAFVVNRPDRITSMDIDPVGWGLTAADRLTLGRASRLTSAMRSMADRLPFRMSKVDPLVAFISASNALTGGMAGRRLGISMETLERRMLLQHFMQHHAMFMTSMRAWRAVPDWTDPAQVPEAHREAVVA